MDSGGSITKAQREPLFNREMAYLDNNTSLLEEEIEKLTNRLDRFSTPKPKDQPESKEEECLPDGIGAIRSLSTRVECAGSRIRVIRECLEI
jgi:hypothetical protein